MRGPPPIGYDPRSNRLVNILWFVPILSVMMFVHELGHFITARLSGITVLEFGFGLPPRLWGFKRNGVIYSINWIPFGAFVKMLGEEDPTAPGQLRQQAAPHTSAGPVGRQRDELPAGRSGLQHGLYRGRARHQPGRAGAASPRSPPAALPSGRLAVQRRRRRLQRPARQRPELPRGTQSHLDQPIQIDLQRGDQTQSTTLTPRSNPPEGQGAIGIVISGGLIHLNPLTAIQQGFLQTLHVIGVTLSVPKMLLEGTIAPSDARLVGLVGMAQATSETVSYVADTGFWYPLFVLTGLFSAGLSIANMLPIPALDGGRLFFVILEWIRGRRIPPEREAAYHFVGIMVLLTIMVIISFNDLMFPMPGDQLGRWAPTPVP